MTFRWCDETDFGFGWVVEDRLRRTGHALAAAGRVWLVDPVAVPGLEERVRARGEPAGVVQLLDRHGRDCAALAARLNVPLHVVPRAAIAGAPFEPVRVVDVPRWREAALWWPERRVLVCADAVLTNPAFAAPGERASVHLLLALFPPRRLAAYEPLHLLTGHGEGIHGPEAAAALRRALARSRRDLPRGMLVALRSFRA